MALDENETLFVQECRDMLDDLESALLALENNPTSTESINSAFRAVHTIKGSAGLFGLDDIIEFNHVVEHLLDMVRSGKLLLNSELVTLLFKAKDHALKQVEAFEVEKLKPIAKDQTAQKIIKALQQALSTVEQNTKGVTDEAEKEAPKAQATPRQPDIYLVNVRLESEFFEYGFDPLPLLNGVQSLGEVIDILPVFSPIAALEAYNPECAYMGWEIAIKTELDKPALAEFFEFYPCIAFTILPPDSQTEAYISLLESLPMENLALGQLLLKIGAITDTELQAALHAHTEQGAKSGETLVDQKSVREAVVNKALEKQEKQRLAEKSVQQFVRINAGKLDTLVNLVAELVINGAKISELTGKSADLNLVESVEEMTEALEEVRELTLSLRMVEIEGTFNRFQRVVRDAAVKQNKKIALVIEGGETELDKSVIEHISDPLTHLIRNAIGHGIELPKDRLAAGKDETGQIRLNAFHETGAVVIEVQDDGKGLDKTAIYAKALDKGLISPSDDLSEYDIFQLIFEPGFSTAKVVDDLSGRGVGMDVVKRNIESLRGQVDVESTTGQGAKFTVRLPLTLAIIDGFHLIVGGESFIVPLDMVKECVNLSDFQDEDSKHHNHITLRGELLPLIQLREHLNLPDTSQNRASWKRNMVVVEYAGQRAGLMIDSWLGNVQAVIKPLGKVFEGVPGFSCFTILASGSVALILDIPSLIRDIVAKERKRHQKAKTKERIGQLLD